MTTNDKYAALISDALWGPKIDTRNSPAYRTAGKTLQFTGASELPLVTTRKTAWKNALREMEWFLSGSNNVNDLHQDVRKWWEPWANPKGFVRYNYGEQFRHCDGFFHEERRYIDFDQVEWLVGAVRAHPYSRRNLISTWNTGEMAQSDCPITNCHGTIIHVFGHPVAVAGGGQRVGLELLMYQRSCDLILGVPHNWIQYWAFLLWLAHRTGHLPIRFTWIGGDVHVYQEHREVAEEIIRANKDAPSVPPTMTYEPTQDEFRADDFTITDVPAPAVTSPVRMIV